MLLCLFFFASQRSTRGLRLEEELDTCSETEKISRRRRSRRRRRRSRRRFIWNEMVDPNPTYATDTNLAWNRCACRHCKPSKSEISESSVLTRGEAVDATNYQFVACHHCVQSGCTVDKHLYRPWALLNPIFTGKEVRRGYKCNCKEGLVQKPATASCFSIDFFSFGVYLSWNPNEDLDRFNSWCGSDLMPLENAKKTLDAYIGATWIERQWKIYAVSWEVLILFNSTWREDICDVVELYHLLKARNAVDACSDKEECKETTTLLLKALVQNKCPKFFSFIVDEVPELLTLAGMNASVCTKVVEQADQSPPTCISEECAEVLNKWFKTTCDVKCWEGTLCSSPDP
eukprot:TRINITY_DN74119_c0_g1_i1.p1 TRINITY_DN74119_c0_g1~~TRINITY_DN74119_c0_g1_i1.p1  ORF type:complete len:373 (+),score=36.23 TRINITY_DN74119_c0_g1_i1:87-1121(+)